MRVEYDMAPPPDQINVYLRLFNPEKDRRVDLVNHHRHFKSATSDRRHSYSRFYNYHGKKLVGSRGLGVWGVSKRLRAIKEAGPQIFYFQGRDTGGWVGPLSYRWGPMNFDCDRYRVGIYISIPKQKEPFDIILKRFHVLFFSFLI